MSAPLYIPLVRDPKKILAGHADDSVSAASVIPPLAVDSQFVYVAKWGADTNTGGPFDPFLTISAALASISDASSDKLYTVLIGPGSYGDETTHALLRNYIYLRALAFNQFNDASQSPLVFIETIDEAPITVQAGTIVTGAANVNFNVDVELDAGAHNACYTFDNVYFSANLKQFTGNYVGKTFLNNCLLLNNSLRVKSGEFFLNGSYINDIELTVLGEITITSRYSYIGSTFADTTVNTWRYQIFLYSTDAFQNGSELSDSGANNQCGLFSDASSITSSVVIDPPVTLTFLTTAPYIGYTPNTPADWGATVPSTIQQALDLIAANLAPVS